MPAPLKVDWRLAQAMFQEGIGLKAIAARTGIPYAGLAKRQQRYNWKPTVLAPAPAPGAFRPIRAKPSDVPCLVSQWKDKILSITDVHLSRIQDKSSSSGVTLDELEKLARVLDVTDRTARRTLGLDNERHDHVTLHVQSELTQPERRELPAQTDQVVDVETVPIQDTAQPESVKSAESPTNPT